MTHCEYLDEENNPCESTTPCTIQCRECLLDVCEEHQAIGSKKEHTWDREGDEGDITEAMFKETVLCLRCFQDIEDFERRVWIRQETKKAAPINRFPTVSNCSHHIGTERRSEKRTNTGEIVAKGHIKATEGSK